MAHNRTVRRSVITLFVMGCVVPVVCAQTFYLGGIQVHEPDHARWVAALDEAGMNTVAVTAYAHQGAWDTDHLWFNESEPAVLDEIRAARAAGLHVVLVLRVAADHAFPENEFIWHGMIMPRSDEMIDSWFRNYTRFVTLWAAIAEREGVDVLGIGSEMNALSATLPITRWGNLKNYYGYYWYQRMSRKRARRFAEEIREKDLWVRGAGDYETLEDFLDARYRRTVSWARQAYLRREPDRLERINHRRQRINEHWIELIRRVREIYRGRLTYGANFDNYRDVGFWRHLDLIGINGYFPLRNHLNRELSDGEKSDVFRESWRTIFEDIRRFRREQEIEGMPFMFTELGYTFRESSTVEPWAHGGFSVVGWGVSRRRLVVWKELPLDYDERRLAVEALRQVHAESAERLLTGILYWKLSSIRELESIEPFMLHVGADSADGLQDALVGFLR